ncbi:Cytochrome P450 [Apiospora marii]|uniref:Cytochrome P450 n=1 Tax=Apiospora marii TaxID=335849 RepID=A0ABR1SVD7_9PEZI
MAGLRLLSEVKPAHLGLALMVAAAFTGLLYIIVLRPVYNLLFHPLRKYPGPKLWAATQLPYLRNWIGGYAPQKILELHHQYGDVIRVAPNELSYLRPDAWREIMGYIPRGVLENEKDPLIFRGLNVEDSLIGAPREHHRALRSVLSHGFSASRLLDQQPIIMRYVDLLVERLREKTMTDKEIPVNMVLWYNYATFDIIGDLAFGESFGCLESSALHPWVAVVFKWLKFNAHVVQCRRVIPWAFEIVDAVLGRMATSQVQEHIGYINAKLDKRLGTVTDRPDFVDSMLRTDKAGLALTRNQLMENANLFIVAGSETTATTLCFTTWLLLTHPEVMRKVTDELLAAFTREEEITFHSVLSLKYLIAVFDEALRLYPPVPVTVPRQVPPGGRQICGDHIPENTKVGIWHYPMSHHAGHFALPDEFHPERWLGEDPRFAHDRKEAFEPFSHGSRNCLGKNLAYAEMRTIMARMLFNFDMRLANGYEKWADRCPIHNLWEKPPLLIHFKPRDDQDREILRSRI